MVRKFLKTFVVSLLVFSMVLLMVVVGYGVFGSNENSENGGFSFRNIGGSVLDFIAPANNGERDNFLIAGLDDGTRTDLIMIGSFDHATKSLDIISLPRDIRVIMPQDRFDILRSEGRVMNADRSMKLNEVHHHAGNNRGMDFLRLQIEEMLDIELDFYVKVDIDAFIYIVDAIGGVYFDVPQRMYYHDPTQNLLINLHPGYQLLDGAAAEGLVRFRTYQQADLRRVEIQQEFIKALISQVLSRENVLNNATTIATAAFRYVETDLSLTRALSYVRFLNGFSVDNINTYTIPTTPRPRVAGGRSYLDLNEVPAKELIDFIFRDGFFSETTLSHNKRIQVLNGGNESGLAARGRNILEENGYSVTAIGDFSGVRANNTRIFVNSLGLGEDISELFENSRIVFDPTMDQRFDIVVVIGTDGI